MLRNIFRRKDLLVDVEQLVSGVGVEIAYILRIVGYLDRRAAGIRVGLLSGKPVDSRNSREAEHVVKGTILEHQDNQMLDSGVV